jgi:hypothetical protein
MWRMSRIEALIFIAAVVVLVAVLLLAWSLTGGASRWQGGRGCFYLTNPHQTAKAAVPKMAVMAIEINSESAANLIQSVTVAIFSRRNCHVAVWWEVTALQIDGAILIIRTILEFNAPTPAPVWLPFHRLCDRDRHLRCARHVIHRNL